MWNFPLRIFSRGMWGLFRPPTWASAATILLSLQTLMIFFDLHFLKYFFQIPKNHKNWNSSINVIMAAVVILAGLALGFTLTWNWYRQG